MLVTLLPIVILAIVIGIIVFRISANKGKNAGEPKEARTISQSPGNKHNKSEKS
jgi:hypothetical protein